jgi:hypothetical protein
MAFGIDDAIGAGLKIINKFIPDPVEKIKAESELRDSLQKWDQAQTEVNKVEAGNSSLFVSGWRPAIGWVCSIALLYQYILVPFVSWGFLLSGTPLSKPPVLDGTLWELMFGMLGLGGLRTYEKLKGVAK